MRRVLARPKSAAAIAVALLWIGVIGAVVSLARVPVYADSCENMGCTTKVDCTSNDTCYCNNPAGTQGGGICHVNGA
jgi:hypothetical protein